MKILAASDLHDEEAALEKIIARAGGYDYVLVAGDVGRSEGFAEDLLSSGGNIFVVPGNGDGDFLAKVAGKKWLHGRRVEIGEGLNLVGFGYSPPTPFHTHFEFPEEKLYGWMKDLPIDGKTIFLTHAPPHGILDDVAGAHAGSRAVRRIVEEKKPLANVCAHIHEREGVAVMGSTTVLKVAASKRGRAGEIEISNGRMNCRNIGL
ncbi:MAG: metallophosphoesterase [Candidatus Micrarchaeota archaeon]